MKIRYSKNAMKFLNKLDKRSVLRIVAGIEGLTLKPPAGDIKVMQGLKDGTMRLRRGIFTINTRSFNMKGACFTGTERKTRWRFYWCWISGIVAISINKEVAGCLKLQ